MKEYKPKEIEKNPIPQPIIANAVISESINTKERSISFDYKLGSDTYIIPYTSATDPTSGMTEGVIYYNSSERCLKVYIDTVWKAIQTAVTVSPSVSPSASVSPSISVSPSASPSRSVSPSSSASPSTPPCNCVGGDLCCGGVNDCYDPDTEQCCYFP